MGEEKKASGGREVIGRAFGEAVALMVASPKHKSLFLSDLEWALMPAVMLGQFRVFRMGEDDRPVGVALWAFLDEESEARLTQAGKLRPTDWKSGDRLWLVEIVSPMGGADKMLANLKRTVFAGKAFHYHVTDPKGVRRVVEERGDDSPESVPPKSDG